jgi:acyl dehydratase
MTAAARPVSAEPAFSASRPVSGRWLEDLPEGLVVRHALTRTITEADNVLFTAVTMNPAPMHLDAEYARGTEFGRVLVNSMFTLALLVGLSVHELTMGTTVANLGFEQVAFPAPLFHGDTLSAESTIISNRPSRSRPNDGVVVFEHRGLRQDGVLVARCRRAALMRRRPTA